MIDPPKTLCQPDGTKSCGACCGMYNQRGERSHQVTLKRLAHRTLAYRRACDVRDVATLQAFREEWEPAPDEKLLDGLPSCPFLGLLELSTSQLESESLPTRAGRVGCLVHPLQNDGVDGRDCGVYDRFICEDYLCASHDVMKRDEKLLVLRAIEDSYLYGLVITDTRFVRELFSLTANINGMMPTASTLHRAEAIDAAAAYFELKRDWPWRGEDGIFGQVIPEVSLDTSRRPGPSEQLGVEANEYEAILRCLGSVIESEEDLERARARVSRCVARFADAVALSPAHKE